MALVRSTYHEEVGVSRGLASTGSHGRSCDILQQMSHGQSSLQGDYMGIKGPDYSATRLYIGSFYIPCVGGSVLQIRSAA